jgi:hypothetical protein
MDRYTRDICGEWLGKHITVATQQIFNNATVGLQQGKSSVFDMIRAEMLKVRDQISLVSSVRECVKRGLEPEAEK